MRCFIEGKLFNICPSQSPKKDGSGTWYRSELQFLTTVEGRAEFVNIVLMDDKPVTLSADILTADKSKKEVRVALDVNAKSFGERGAELNVRILSVHFLDTNSKEAPKP